MTNARSTTVARCLSCNREVLVLADGMLRLHTVSKDLSVNCEEVAHDGTRIRRYPRDGTVRQLSERERGLIEDGRPWNGTRTKKAPDE